MEEVDCLATSLPCAGTKLVAQLSQDQKGGHILQCQLQMASTGENGTLFPLPCTDLDGFGHIALPGHKFRSRCGARLS